jgi:hypothetical protein
MKMIRTNDGYTCVHKKSVVDREINEETGTRFKKFTVQQHAFEELMKLLKAGIIQYKELCRRFNNIKISNGSSVNLDSSYLSLTLSSHPDFFKIDLDYNIHVIKYPVASCDEDLRKARSKMMKDDLKKRAKKRLEREEVKAIVSTDTITEKKQRRIDNTKDYEKK